MREIRRSSFMAVDKPTRVDNAAFGCFLVFNFSFFQKINIAWFKENILVVT